MIACLIGVAAPAVAQLAELEVIWNGQLSMSRMPATASQWQWLLARGANSIVNLEDRMIDFAQYGFASFLWVRPGSAGIPTNESAERFLAFIQMPDSQPVHIASVARNRRGTMGALLRYAIDGWTIAQALAEGQRLSKDGLRPEQIAWLLRWAATYPPGSHRRAGF